MPVINTIFQVTITSNSLTLDIGSTSVHLVEASGTGSKMFYDNEAAELAEIKINESPAAIQTAAGNLIALTSSVKVNEVFYLNADRIIKVLANGTGAKIFFDNDEDEATIHLVTETPAAVRGLINALLPTAGNDWRLIGNAGTIDGTNFIGTTDNIPFNIRVNNQKAGKINLTGDVFYGYQAGNVNAGVTLNTGIGYQALLSNTSGALHVAVGVAALFKNTTGSGNTAIGASALSENTTGGGNISLGNSAGRTNTTGSNNILIGEFSDVASGALTNAIAIGRKSLVTTSNSLILGSINGVNGATVDTRVGIGTTSPATSAILDLTSTVGALLIPRMTTAQRDALTAVDGMFIYNTTTAKFQGREAGAWVNLI